MHLLISWMCLCSVSRGAQCATCSKMHVYLVLLQGLRAGIRKRHEDFQPTAEDQSQLHETGVTGLHTFAWLRVGYDRRSRGSEGWYCCRDLDYGLQRQSEFIMIYGSAWSD
ncbi:hypothetical protein F4808DRAFT_174781 [Astrocystis sublimbata]|nr:hypothetical protein F4808DRAFT_174781 [Astrocystis sublimbata]